MHQHSSKNAIPAVPPKMLHFPASELANALGLPPALRSSLGYTHQHLLHKKLIDVCTRCAIRFGIPDEVRKHIGDSIGLPDEPVLRCAHQGIPSDSRWEALANALSFSPLGQLHFVEVEVQSREALRTIKESLPSLLEDIDLLQRLTNRPPANPTLRPISKELGDQLVTMRDQVAAFGDNDTSPAGHRRQIAQHMERQMRIYAVLGPQWTLVTPLERFALSTCSSPDTSDSSARTFKTK